MTAGGQISVTEAAGLGLITVLRQINSSQQKSSAYGVKTTEQQVNSNLTANMYKCVRNQNQKCERNKVLVAHISGQLRAAYSAWVTIFALMAFGLLHTQFQVLHVAVLVLPPQ